MRDMNIVGKNPEEDRVRWFRIQNRCKKQKHAPITNNFGVTWCKDCGTLIKNV